MTSRPGQPRFLPAGGPQLEQSGYSYTSAGCFGRGASSHVPRNESEKMMEGSHFSEKSVPAEHLVFLKHLKLSAKQPGRTLHVCVLYMCVCVCVCSGLYRKFTPWHSPLKINCENV